MGAPLPALSSGLLHQIQRKAKALGTGCVHCNAETGLYGQAPKGSLVGAFVTSFPLAPGPGVGVTGLICILSTEGQLWVGF